MKSVLVVNAKKVIPKVADKVATAERSTLSGVYIEQIKETR